MTQKRIGLAIAAKDSKDVLDKIQRAEALGVSAAWLTTGGTRMDALTLFSAAAVQTQQILLGTSIIPTWPRHPIAIVQQVQVLAQLSNGRFRLGVGPSHKDAMIQTFGAAFIAPLGHMREYLRILKALLQQGKVDLDGRYYTAHAAIDAPLDVPVLTSALRRRSYVLSGAEADGAISWVCPGKYLRDVALPAMKVGAKKAGRAVPPLIAHAPVAVHEKADEVREAVRKQMSTYVRLPFYSQMFSDAGFPEALEGIWSDAMVDAVAIHGDEEEVSKQIHRLLSYGATEIICSPVLMSPDPDASWERTVKALAQIGCSLKD